MAVSGHAPTYITYSKSDVRCGILETMDTISCVHDGIRITFSADTLDTLPDGLTIDTSTGSISGTISSGVPTGLRTVTITATCLDGGATFSTGIYIDVLPEGAVSYIKTNVSSVHIDPTVVCDDGSISFGIKAACFPAAATNKNIT